MSPIERSIFVSPLMMLEATVDFLSEHGPGREYHTFRRLLDKAVKLIDEAGPLVDHHAVLARDPELKAAMGAGNGTWK